MNRGQQGTQEIQQEQMSSPATVRQGPAEMKAGGTGKQLLGAALGTGGHWTEPGPALCLGCNKGLQCLGVMSRTWPQEPRDDRDCPLLGACPAPVWVLPQLGTPVQEWHWQIGGRWGEDIKTVGLEPLSCKEVLHLSFPKEQGHLAMALWYGRFCGREEWQGWLWGHRNLGGVGATLFSADRC